ncbi:beta-ketoacyl synthase N-terminal-like domain-containing protein [Streptomyces nigra]|uniref:beta-ketoacyl synthase N-terminal-like domain-containing protein n=1 Tax=Streptomyces nigra TaxID=1827580 RepID=UPI00365F81B0
MLEAAREAAQQVDLPRDRTMVVIGMGCDARMAQCSAGHREAGSVGEGLAPAPSTCAAGGATPDAVAGRISSALDLTGAAFVVCAEQASGLAALDIGARALRTGEADVVLAGAVNLPHEPVHRRAPRALGVDGGPGDAAIVIVLKRLADARRDDDQVLAVLGGPANVSATLLVGDVAADASGHIDHFDPADSFGVPYAVNGLLAVACAAVALRHGATPRTGRPATPCPGRRAATAAVDLPEAGHSKVTLRADRIAPWLGEAPPVLQSTPDSEP